MIDESPPRTYYDGSPRYTAATQDESRREKTLYTQLDWWRIVSVMGLGIILVLVAIVAYLTTRYTVDVKFLVQNEEGQWRIADWDRYQPDDAVIERDLVNWLWCVRSITTDREVTRKCWERVPMFLLKKTQCHATIATYSALRKPEQALFHKAVLIDGEIQAVHEHDGRWSFSWTEKTYSLDHGAQGNLESTTPWKATMLVTRRKPEKKKEIEINGTPVNPLGVYCQALTWSY